MSWNQPQDAVQTAWNLFQQNRLTEAEARIRPVVEAQPQHYRAIMILAYTQARLEKLDEAEKTFHTALAISPTSFEALNWLASILCRQGRYGEAKDFADRAVKIQPKSGDAWNNLGLAYSGLEQHGSAIEAFLEALRVEAPGPDTLFNLGMAFFKAGDNVEAARAFAFQVQRNPNDVVALLRLSEARHKTGELDLALASAARAAELAPNLVDTQLAHGWAWVNFGRAEIGQTHLEKALALDPNNAQTITLIGASYQTLGKFEAAREWLQRAIKLDPYNGSSYYHLFNNEKVGADLVPYVEQAEELLASDRLTQADRVLMGYGLGKALDNLKEYQRAMACFDAANAILLEQKSKVKPFDRQEFTAGVDRIMELYQRLLPRAGDLVASESDLPLLIVGMIRSGTTLMEQILSSHPDVAPGGEIGFMARENAIEFPDDETAIGALRAEGEQYFKRLEGFGPGKKITDKLPGNYFAIGLLSLILPGSKFIEMRRHPVDTCLSVWMMALRVQPTFAHNKSDIVYFYREYLRLMAFWQEVIPSDRLMRVQYEEIVRDREPVLRSAVEFCGLPWDNALLSHEKNDRTVVTPSLWQVRQPIYTTSRERWRNYEPWLGEFRHLLENTAN